MTPVAQNTLFGYPVPILTSGAMIPAAVVDAVNLTYDFANGLAYLHEEHRMRHVDIKPNNLGLRWDKTSQTWAGVVLDLDRAEQCISTRNQKKGTFKWLALEILALKRGETSQPFTRTVDMWCLSASICTIFGEGIQNTRTAPRRRSRYGVSIMPRHRNAILRTKRKVAGIE